MHHKNTLRKGEQGSMQVTHSAESNMTSKEKEEHDHTSLQLINEYYWDESTKFCKIYINKISANVDELQKRICDAKAKLKRYQEKMEQYQDRQIYFRKYDRFKKEAANMSELLRSLESELKEKNKNRNNQDFIKVFVAICFCSANASNYTPLFIY